MHSGMIVELKDPDGWHKTTMRDVDFLAVVLGKVMEYRRVEGSFDGGLTWNEWNEDELMLLGKDLANAMQWRVKSNA